VDPRPSRRKLEAEWHQRLKRGRSRYEGKVAIRKEMLAERSEWPISLQPDPGRQIRFASGYPRGIRIAERVHACPKNLH
jgi:hypothetical protein